METRTSTAIVACRVCGQAHSMDRLKPGTVAVCTRCGSMIARHTPESLQVTAALSLAALILYVPANVFPIMRMEIYGAATDNTVWQGCTRLFDDGQWAIAIVVFLASIFIPLLKILGLFVLVTTTWLKLPVARLARTWIYRVIEAVGRWAMLDVFVLAVLVSLVKLQRLATIIPGKGLFAFCGVVVLTLLASASFDSQLIWSEAEEAS
ncbi:MAG TPA: paraquat-inducible protein A [Tepidisphaeraceae bacterium]|nr:paraquat-inducible protein A [Tepidisphaeraceae bacterium]